MNAAALAGARTLVETCAKLRARETALILSTPETIDLGEIVRSAAEAQGSRAIHRRLPAMVMHGTEPPDDVAAEMPDYDVIFCLTRFSLAHSHARRRATDRGSRFLSLPDYSKDVLASNALQVDFDSLVAPCERLASMIDRAARIRVTSAAGADIAFSTGGRRANRAPGIVDKPGQLGSPPDAEVNIAPLEGSAAGVIVVDGSVPCKGVGLLLTPLTMEVENGVVVRCRSADGVARVVEEMFERAGPKSRNVGEFGIGLNPKAKLCGVMLEDEGALGTIHFGIGANATIGGTVSVPFHVDFICKHATVELDGKPIMRDGKILD